MNEIGLTCFLTATAVGCWFAYAMWDDIEPLLNRAFLDEESKYRTTTFVMAAAASAVCLVFLKNFPAAILAFVLMLSFRRRLIDVQTMERRAMLDEQSEIALQMIASLFDVHQDMIRAFEGAADCVPPPMSDELKRVVVEYRAGKSMNEALADFMNRIENRDFEILCKGIMLSEQYGTDTSAVVQEVAQMIRDRIILREELKNELRGQKLTVDIFLLMIPVVGTLLYVFSPEARHTMTETLVGKGIVLILIAVEYAAWRITRGQWVVENL